MKLHRFFVSPETIAAKKFALADKELCHQIATVLKLKIGEEIIALDNSGNEYVVLLEKITKSAVEGVIHTTNRNANESSTKITLYQSLLKKDNFEWVLQKGTELGIIGFTPIVSDRSEKKGLNQERALKIIKEAAEQSERGVLPALHEATTFTESLKNKNVLILDRSGAPLKSMAAKTMTEVAILVGPEGGWSENELAAAKEVGASIVSIGPRTLRAETAGPIAAALLLNE